MGYFVCSGKTVTCMGSRGRIPKRNEERVARNKDRMLQEVEIDTSPAVQPQPDPSWCPAARRIWDAMGVSAQTRFYEASDWAYAQFALDEVTRYIESGKQSGIVLASVDSMLTRLLLTEGDRRRAGIEIQHAQDTNETEMREGMGAWAHKLHST